MKHKNTIFRVFIVVLFINFMILSTAATSLPVNAATKYEPIDKSLINEEYVFDNGYYYEQLGEDEKTVYNELLEASKQFISDIEITPISYESIIKVNYAFINDHPEIFWARKPSVRLTDGIVYSVIYDVPEDAKETSKEIDKLTDDILSQIPQTESDLDKIIFITEFLAENTSYESTENGQNITSVFLDHKSVCAGYSKAFLYLCNKLDIDCAYVIGYTDKDECHAWNLVRIDGKFYWVDSTWADTTLWVKKIFYTMANDDNFLGEHFPNKYISTKKYTTDDVFEYPECISKIDEFRLVSLFIRTHLYYEL